MEHVSHHHARQRHDDGLAQWPACRQQREMGELLGSIETAACEGQHRASVPRPEALLEEHLRQGIELIPAICNSVRWMSRRQSVAGSASNTRSASAAKTCHAPSWASRSSWPVPQPARPRYTRKRSGSISEVRVCSSRSRVEITSTPVATVLTPLIPGRDRISTTALAEDTGPPANAVRVAFAP